ncbi:hypothetical protein ACIO3R_07360 [Streptomyces sp. NPDC087428]|uniref:hypothetical protein n=1 Tax=Streptomyces sp. NPDC087428 TaxID=3365788 RepID=UPI00380509AE
MSSTEEISMYSNTILVVGSVATSDERDDLTAVAFDVCDELGLPTVIATSSDVDVRKFAAVVVIGPPLADPSSTIGTAMIMEAEAALYDVPVIVQQPYADAAPCDSCQQLQTVATVRNEHGEVFCQDCLGNCSGCVQCYADETTEPVFVDGGWVPLCAGCAPIMKVLKPSDRNIVDGETEPLLLLGV